MKKQNAGNYNWAFTWLQCVRTADGTTGDKPKSYTSNGILWGSAKLESANVENEFGAVRSVVTGTVRLRNWPDITTLDRLLWTPSSGTETLIIDGVRKDWDANETVLDVHAVAGSAV